MKKDKFLVLGTAETLSFGTPESMRAASFFSIWNSIMVLKRFTQAFLALGMFLMPLEAGSKTTVPSTLTVGPDQLLVGTIKGAPASIRMIAAGPKTLFLNPETVERLSIRNGMFSGEGRVGPVRKRINTAVLSYSIEGATSKRRVLWSDADYAPLADGGIGPGGVPHAIIVFILRPAAPGEREFELSMVTAPASYGALGTSVRIGGQDHSILFDLTRETSLATAAAAAALSRSNGAQLQGPVGQDLIRLGISRPTRRLILASPLTIGLLQVTDMRARTADNSDGSAIAAEDIDVGEIVVTGKGTRQKPLYSISLGRDALSNCSSLIFNKPERVIRLRCR